MRRSTIDFNKIGKRHDVPAYIAQEIWMSVFRFIREKMATYDFVTMSDEDLEKLNADFIIPGFGMLRLNRKRVRTWRNNCKRAAEKSDNKKTQQHEGYNSEEDQAGVHDGAADLRQV